MHILKDLPAYELHHFAKWVAKATEAYFEDPDVQRRFKEWQKTRNQNQEEK